MPSLAVAVKSDWRSIVMVMLEKMIVDGMHVERVVQMMSMMMLQVGV
jgi:hypothetical protein